jgi:hypothetical protein
MTPLKKNYSNNMSFFFIRNRETRGQSQNNLNGRDMARLHYNYFQCLNF